MTFFAHNFGARVSSRPRAEMNLKLWKFAMEKNLIIVFISLLEWQPSRRWSGDFPGDGQHDIYAKEEWEKLGEIMKFSFSTENSRKLSHWNYQFINHQQSIEGIPPGLRFGTQSALKFVESVHCTANVKADYENFYYARVQHEWTFPHEAHTAVLFLRQSKLVEWKIPKKPGNIRYKIAPSH